MHCQLMGMLSIIISDIPNYSATKQFSIRLGAYKWSGKNNFEY